MTPWNLQAKQLTLWCNIQQIDNSEKKFNFPATIGEEKLIVFLFLCKR